MTMQQQGTSTTPLVTIRCITYNHEPYIRQCLEGFVMQQTNFPFEAIVHDDASTDGSATIIVLYNAPPPLSTGNLTAPAAAAGYAANTYK